MVLVDGVGVSREGRVLTIRFAAPPRNYLTRAIVGALAELVGRLSRDRSVGAVILTGEGSAFSTHFAPGSVAPSSASTMPLSTRGAHLALSASRGLRRLPGFARLLDRTPAAGLADIDN